MSPQTGLQTLIQKHKRQFKLFPDVFAGMDIVVDSYSFHALARLDSLLVFATIHGNLHPRILHRMRLLPIPGDHQVLQDLVLNTRNISGSLEKAQSVGDSLWVEIIGR